MVIEEVNELDGDNQYMPREKLELTYHLTHYFLGMAYDEYYQTDVDTVFLAVLQLSIDEDGELDE